MEKRNYVKPLLNSEEFVPQTYVAGCQPTNGELTYYISCAKKGGFPYHNPNYCGSPTAYEITINDEYKITKLYENPHTGFSKGDDAYDIQVNGKTYTSVPTEPICTDPNKPVTIGWKTKDDLGFTYNHQGTITLSQATIVNAS